MAVESHEDLIELGAATSIRELGAAGAVPKVSGAESGEHPKEEQARSNTVEVESGARELKVYEVSDDERFAAIRVPLRRSSKRVIGADEDGAVHVNLAVALVAADCTNTGAAGGVEAEAWVAGKTETRARAKTGKKRRISLYRRP
jgi:hypothetical protein